MQNQFLSLSSIVFLIFFTACGSLKLNPRACHTNGVWSDSVGPLEKKYSEVYYVWNQDYEVSLKEFLKERNKNCSFIKKMRVEIATYFFIRRELTLFIVIE